MSIKNFGAGRAGISAQVEQGEQGELQGLQNQIAGQKQHNFVLFAFL